MKILIVSNSDRSGGAAIAAWRLHEALLNEGILSYMFVQNKITNYKNVIGPASELSKFLARLRSPLDKLKLIFYNNKAEAIFFPAIVPFSQVISKINSIKPDLVHLHWISGGMLRIEDLSKIDVPVVWSLHDDWAYTGGCHIKWECERFKSNCGKCPQLGSNKEMDLSRKVWKRKQKSYAKIRDLTIVGLSRWTCKCASESGLLSKNKVINLPNLINTSKFKQVNKSFARDIFNLPQNKKIVLFGNLVSLQSVNKGFRFFHEALGLLNNNIEVALISDEPLEININKKLHLINRQKDEVSMVLLYSAVDCLVVPSLQENLSNTIMEALACGLPVVAFNVGGNSDLIDHKINGYLARKMDSNDLAQGINWIINSNLNLSENARLKILSEFDSRKVVKKYIALYSRLVVNSADHKNQL